MTPMTGGMGMGGGSGGLPGPGTARQDSSGRGAKPTATPGLPPALRGKADRVDRSAFSLASRSARPKPAAEPGSVHLLDEEMWQVPGTQGPGKVDHAV